MDDSELMRICSVGGNPVSAFLSWRLQATNACDVTLVWKSGYDHVAQYGISFKYVQRLDSNSIPTDRLFLDPMCLAMNDSSRDMVRRITSEL
jgi:hypothetical protein